MAFPIGWETGKGFPPVPNLGQSIRFFRTDTTTANFIDKAYSFADGETLQKPIPYIQAGSTAPVEFGDRSFRDAPLGGGRDLHDAALHHPFDPATVGNPITNKQPVAINLRYSYYILIRNLGGSDIEFSFNGVDVHGKVPAGTTRIYPERREAGISLRQAAGVIFELEVW